MSSHFLIRLRGTENGIVDLAGNTWTIGSTISSTNNVAGVFGDYCIKNTGTSYIYKTSIDPRLLFTPSDKWTFSCWIRPLPTSSSDYDFCCLLNGGRALDHQRISYKHRNMGQYQPNYISPSDGSNAPPSNSISIYASEMEDGNWHHIAVTQDGLGYIRVFYDGECVKQRTEPNNVDWGATSGTGILGELNGDDNAYCYGYFDDICLIGGEALWTSDFTPPTGYLSFNSTIYLTGAEAWGINGSGNFAKLNNNYSAMTNAEKIAMFDATNRNTPTIAQLKTLTMPIKVVHYSGDITSHTCKVSAVPKDQLVLPKNLINLSSIEHINSVTVTANESGTGKVRIAITKGNNVWYMFDGLNFVQIGNTASDFLADGNTASEINGITQAQWDSFGADEIGFGYVLHIENTTDVANVDNLSMSVLAKGSWNKAVYGTDYTYGYPANNTLRVDILADGDYKINYAK